MMLAEVNDFLGPLMLRWHLDSVGTDCFVVRFINSSKRITGIGLAPTVQEALHAAFVSVAVRA